MKLIKIMSFVVAGCAFLAMTDGSFTGASAAAEGPPYLLKASNVLPEKLLKGSNYVIEESVENDGIINTYRLTTPYGILRVESTTELMIRIAELNAMGIMAEMDRQQLFGTAMEEGIKAPFKGIVALATDPVETSKGIVTGAGRFFSNMGRAIVSDDPYQDNAFKVAVGYDAVKRAYAFEFSIDPYSEFGPAMSMLSSVAQASAAGGLTPRVAMSAINMNVVTILSVSGTAEGLRKLVRDNPPGELADINRRKLLEMGVPQSLTDAFVNNYIYSPQDATVLVGQLDRLTDVKGRSEFMAAANLAASRPVSRLYRVMAEMMAEYREKQASVTEIGRAAGIPYLRTGDDTVAVLLPIDHLFPAPEVLRKLETLNDTLAKAGVARKEMWITGMVDDSMQPYLQQRNWRVVTDAGRILLQ